MDLGEKRVRENVSFCAINLIARMTWIVNCLKAKFVYFSDRIITAYIELGNIFTVS